MASAFGAASGADMLQSVLRRKMQEQHQIAMQQEAAARLAESIRQADMQQAMGHARIAQGDRDLGFRRERAGVSDKQYADAAPQRAVNLRLATANATNAEGLPGREAAGRAFTLERDEAGRKFTGKENAANRANAREIAATRAAAPKVQQIRGVDANGRKVVRLVDVNSGEELGAFDAGMSPEEFVAQLQKESAARAAGAAEGKQAAGGGGLFDLVAGLFSGGDKGAAAKPAGVIRARDAQGKLHEAPAGTPLPAGWRQE